MRTLTLAFAVLAFASTVASAASPQRRHAHVRPAQPSEAAVKNCLITSRYVQGKGRDVKQFLYFDECMRRGGRL